MCFAKLHNERVALKCWWLFLAVRLYIRGYPEAENFVVQQELNWNQNSETLNGDLINTYHSFAKVGRQACAVISYLAASDHISKKIPYLPTVCKYVLTPFTQELIKLGTQVRVWTVNDFVITSLNLPVASSRAAWILLLLYGTYLIAFLGGASIFAIYVFICLKRSRHIV